MIKIVNYYSGCFHCCHSVCLSIKPFSENINIVTFTYIYSDLLPSNESQSKDISSCSNECSGLASQARLRSPSAHSVLYIMITAVMV